MLLVWPGQGQVLVDAHRYHLQDIHHRNAQYQQRHEGAHGRGFALAHADGQPGHHKAQKLAAGVAHEDARRVGVEAQEAHHPRRHRQGDRGHLGVARFQRQHKNQQQGHERGAGGQAVHAVGEVHPVDHPQHKNKGDTVAEPTRAAGDERRVGNHHAAGHGNAHPEGLASQLVQGFELYHIVYQAEADNHQAGQQKAEQALVQRQHNQQRHRRRQDNAQPAAAGHGVVVQLAGVAGGVVHQVQPGRVLDQHRNQQQRQHQGDQKAVKVLDLHR